MNQKKVAIVVALNGGTQQDREGAKVPITPQEIADETYRCYQAGASSVHIHARDEKKAATGDVKVFAEIMKCIRDKCDILIQTTNGIGSRHDPITGAIIRPTEEERLALLHLEPRQDLFSIAGGSWDFFHPGVPDQNQFSFLNPTAFLRKKIPAVHAAGSSIEFEIVQVSFLDRLKRLADEGVFNANENRYWLNYCFGFGGMEPTPRAFAFALDEGRRIFPNAKWQVTATDRAMFPINTMALVQGCDIVRVGFEDNIYLPNGQAAAHNHNQVEAMVRIAREFGREPATVAEAKKIYGLAR
ncbi:MAG: 3-keto-5-aminohexanoate cleavage protein [Betaproteobacteria bacterium]|nr:3-keto-5-aminohexanoate cleavage protein [Betaproteobacteria bacterium]